MVKPQNYLGHGDSVVGAVDGLTHNLQPIQQENSKVLLNQQYLASFTENISRKRLKKKQLKKSKNCLKGQSNEIFDLHFFIIRICLGH